MRKTKVNKKRVNKTKKRKIRGGNGELCPICQEELSFKDSLFNHKTCKNTFHTACIKKWCDKLENEDETDCTCPMCREYIGFVSIDDVEDVMEKKSEKYYNNIDLITKSLETGNILDIMNKEYSGLVDKYNILANKFNTLGGYSRRDIANFARNIVPDSLGNISIKKITNNFY